MFNDVTIENWERRTSLVEEINRRHTMLAKHLEAGDEIAAMLTRNGLTEAYYHLYVANKEYDEAIDAYVHATYEPRKKTFWQKLLRK